MIIRDKEEIIRFLVESKSAALILYIDVLSEQVDSTVNSFRASNELKKTIIKGIDFFEGTSIFIEACPSGLFRRELICSGSKDTNSS